MYHFDTIFTTRIYIYYNSYDETLTPCLNMYLTHIYHLKKRKKERNFVHNMVFKQITSQPTTKKLKYNNITTHLQWTESLVKIPGYSGKIHTQKQVRKRNLALEQSNLGPILLCLEANSNQTETGMLFKAITVSIKLTDMGEENK